MEDLGLGKTITGEKVRDAIHIAVCPLAVARSAKPGAHVGLNEAGEADVIAEKTIGVIDPFLRSPVKRGDRCWVFLYPGTITSLRHEWSHPDLLSPAELEKVKKVTDAITGAEESKKWLMKFAQEWGMDFDDMVFTASSKDGGQWGRYVVANGVDLHDKSELGDNHDLFWEHLERYTGRKYSDKHREETGWSCSC